MLLAIEIEYTSELADDGVIHWNLLRTLIARKLVPREHDYHIIELIFRDMFRKLPGG